MNKDQIIREISDFIRSNGGFPNEWYVGISNDAEKRLFEDHNVDRRRGLWIWRPAETPTATSEIERHFVESVRTDGGLGGGDETATEVYAYKKSGQTSP